jgi:hypothetical protein
MLGKSSAVLATTFVSLEGLRLSTRLKSLLAVLAVAVASTSCAGGGSSSTMPSVLPSGSQAPAATAARQISESKHDDGDHPATPAFTLFGDAVLVHPGNHSHTAVQASWAPAPGAPYGGIDFAVPAGLKVPNLNTLSTDFKFTQGTCSQGSPRFQINVLGNNVFVYLGPQFPSVTNPCAGATYSNSTNVIGPTSLVDATQLGNGYETWSAFQAQHPNDVVTGIQLVVDGYVAAAPITAQFDNVRINQTLYTFERGRGEGGDDGDNGHHGDGGGHDD